MANAGRVHQRLREMAGVAYALGERERLSDLLDAGDHTAFRQQAVRFFGAAPADVDPQDYILKLEADFKTQKSFYARLNAARRSASAWARAVAASATPRASPGARRSWRSSKARSFSLTPRAAALRDSHASRLSALELPRLILIQIHP